MPSIMIQCNKCYKIFSSGIFMTAGATNNTFINNKSQCPFCGSMENIPDGTFTATVDGFIEILRGSKNPLQEALDIYNGLKNAKNYDDLSKIANGDKIEKFLKQNEIKIAVGIAIIQVIIALYKSEPTIEINNTIINQQFYNQYNQTINIESKNN